MLYNNLEGAPPRNSRADGVETSAKTRSYTVVDMCAEEGGLRKGNIFGLGTRNGRVRFVGDDRSPSTPTPVTRGRNGKPSSMPTEFRADFIRLDSESESQSSTTDSTPMFSKSAPAMSLRQGAGITSPWTTPNGNQVPATAKYVRLGRRMDRLDYTVHGLKVPSQLESPDKGFLGDDEDDSDVEMEFLRNTELPETLRQELQEQQRFCIFGTNEITQRECWDLMRQHFPPQILRHVTRVQRVNQSNGRPRMDIWINAVAAPNLKKAFGLDSDQRRLGYRRDRLNPSLLREERIEPVKELRRWRLSEYKSYRERNPRHFSPVVGDTPKKEKPRGLLTLNVNGVRKRGLELFNLLHGQNIAVAAIQETLVKEGDYPLLIDGYSSYAIPAKDGFRGQAILISNLYTSYEIVKNRGKYHLHVRVSGLTSGAPWHVIGVYLPSGGNMRSIRNKALQSAYSLEAVIRKNEKGAKVVILGDHNMTREWLEQKIKPERSGLHLAQVAGSDKTFHRKNTTWSNIDHIVLSTPAKELVTVAKVMRTWAVTTDHFPLICYVKAQPVVPVQKEKPRYVFDKDSLRAHGHKIVFHNRWQSLSTDPIGTKEELDEAAKAFSDTTNDIAMELGIKKQILGRVFVLNRGLKKLVDRAHKAQNLFKQAVAQRSKDIGQLEADWKGHRLRARKAIAKREQELKQRLVKRVAKLLARQETRRLHQWEASMTSPRTATENVMPVKDESGTLLTEKKEIIERHTEYYKNLLKDDSDGLPKEESYWRGRAKTRTKLKNRDFEKAPTWPQCIMAMRSSATGTAPGDDDIPIDMYKVLIKTECTEHLERQGIEVVEHTLVALPEHQLPLEACTPMGKALHRVLLGIWETKSQPDAWKTATNVSLFKKGDPTDLGNYRGVSLIVVAMKLMTTILAIRLSESLELNGLIMKGQGGFRSKEEAIAQFISLSEIVRRRRVKNLKTYVIFIDFMKAFDKVIHEALFEKLRAKGYEGPFLELIQSIYRNSKARVRVGGEFGVLYDLLRGTRQGCPLSPILFLIFIDDLEEYLPKGVTIPGLLDTCSSLLFADDVAGLADCIEKVQQCLEGIVRWAKDWGMLLGAPKCGVMMIGGDAYDQAIWRENKFYVDEYTIDCVSEYKYLGITITYNLGDDLKSDETAHTKFLAKRVRQAVNIRREFFRDPQWPVAIKMEIFRSKVVPLGLYGGEWLGLNQKRTALIQTEVNNGLKLILGSSSKSKQHSTLPTVIDLGLLTVEQMMAEARLRLHGKSQTMKTWIKDLVQGHLSSRKKTWSTQTERMITDMIRSSQKEDGGYLQWKDVYDAEGSVIDYTELHKINRTTSHKFFFGALRQFARIHVLNRAFSTEKARQSRKTQLYLAWNFAATRRFVKHALFLPSLAEGVLWLIRVRTGGWWTVESRANALAMRSDIENVSIKKGTCPACGVQFRNSHTELSHLLIECSKWNIQRRKYLRIILGLLAPHILGTPVGFLDTKSHRWEEMAMWMIGGFPSIHNIIGPIYGNRKQRDFVAANVATNPLIAFAGEWGGLVENLSESSGTPHYVAVAAYLQEVMPLYREFVFKDTSDCLQPRPTRAGYFTTDDEVSPVKPRGSGRANITLSGLTTPPITRNKTHQANASSTASTRKAYGDALSGIWSDTEDSVCGSS